MPYLETAQAWLTQSTLLLKARPTTTRITTKYNLSHPSDSSGSKPSKLPKTKPVPESSSTTTTTAPRPEPPRASLILTTYDPISGTTLKYRTTKAAEVGRLIQILGGLGRLMAGLPENAILNSGAEVGDVQMKDGEGEAEGDVTTPVGEKSEVQVQVQVQGQGQGQGQGKSGVGGEKGQGGLQQQGAGGKKGKKKGKR